jgi:integrase/recombinase XerD
MPAKINKLSRVPRKRIPTNPLTVYLHTLAPSGRRSMASLLKGAVKCIDRGACLDSFEWTSLGYEDLVKVRFRLTNKRLSFHSVNATLSALKGVIKTCFNMGLLDADTMLRACAVKLVKGESLPAGKALVQQETRLLLKTANQGKGMIALRNRALLYVLIDTGIRRDELVNLRLADYRPQTSELVVRHGKGNRQRIVSLSKPCACRLAQWMKQLEGPSSPIFCRIRKSQQLTDKPLSAQAVYNIVTSLSKQAGIGCCTPHDLRRTFITNQLEKGVDINRVSKMAGHCDITTTAIYDRRGY